MDEIKDYDEYAYEVTVEGNKRRYKTYKQGGGIEETTLIKDPNGEGSVVMQVDTNSITQEDEE